MDWVAQHEKMHKKRKIMKLACSLIIYLLTYLHITYINFFDAGIFDYLHYIAKKELHIHTYIQ